jgi:N-acetylglutamate synthase-like GNAT family acetyltransferase
LTDPLQNPAWHALVDRQADLALREGVAARYRPAISRLAALAEPSRAALADLARLVDPGDYVLVVDVESIGDLGDAWRASEAMPLVQMLCHEPLASSDLAVDSLGPPDVDDMMELVEQTHPGPFERGTLEMGTYLGRHENGRLVAMAGERMKLPGYTEVSAVCTSPDYTGRGLAEALVRHVAVPIQEAGEVAFLHVIATNARAIGLYERMGFRRSRTALITPLVRV